MASSPKASPYLNEASRTASPRVSQVNLTELALKQEEELRQASISTRKESELPPTNPAYPILAYCGASILMTVVNKYCVSGKDFSMTFLLLTIQSAVCVGAVFIAKKLGMITFRDFDMKDAKNWFPISALLVGVIYTGSKSLQFLSIPVYTVFKNLAIILIAYGEVIWFGGAVTSLTLCSFVLMVLSSMIAGWSDISDTIAGFSGTALAAIDPITGSEIPIAGKATGFNSGYIWMFINCFTTAAYVLSMRKRIKVTGFKDWDTMMYNNLLSIPILVLASIILEDWGTESLARNFPAETRTFLLFSIAFSGAAAVFISYSTAWCVRVTSSTTYSMVGALNKLPVAASGLIFFGDPVTFSSVTSIMTGFFAGIVYAVAKQNQSKEAKAKASEKDIPLYNNSGKQEKL